MLNILWSISSPCPLSFPNPPLTMLWSGKTPWWFPQKRPGVFASERDAKDKLQGDVCVFFCWKLLDLEKKHLFLRKWIQKFLGQGVIDLQYIEKCMAAPPLLTSPTKNGIGHAHLSGTLRCPKPFLEEMSNDRTSKGHFRNTTGGGSEEKKSCKIPKGHQV